MKESNVSKIDAYTIYKGVQIGGQSSWESNKAEKEQRLPRVIPLQYSQFPSNAIWKDYRKILVSKKIKVLRYIKNPAYCKMGNS